MLLKWIANIRISPDPVTPALVDAVLPGPLVTLPTIVVALLPDPLFTLPALVVSVPTDPLFTPFPDPFEFEPFPSGITISFLN